MKKYILPIPFMLTTVIDNHILDLTDLELNREVSIFILGSLLYEKENSKGLKQFNNQIQKIPQFKEYIQFFIENKLLHQFENGYKYAYDVEWNRYLEDYCFDSVTVKKLIKKLFPNIQQYLNTVLAFLEPNIKIV
ncbi:hypothetical protein NO004_530036 [Flavobacterium psychrophilum]|uniref:hypothetical protein n=1 Tax=Flavobacterium psychrophilum TaxID=96345 RepID=UPI000B7C385D|nr:hypothetical protein [Flavobacterium psychrophilum]SNB29803.1 hypothetical protein NO004_530036 [Flavobacterium psychrophilum]